MKAQSNIRKFFKKVATILPKAIAPKDLATEGVNKPENQLTQERTKVSTAQHETKTYSRPPYFESQYLAKLRRERKARVRMQKHSRRVNFGLA
jgi:hypothetical protein